MDFEKIMLMKILMNSKNNGSVFGQLERLMINTFGTMFASFLLLFVLYGVHVFENVT